MFCVVEVGIKMANGASHVSTRGDVNLDPLAGSQTIQRECSTPLHELKRRHEAIAWLEHA
jgi:hypothetical protein